MAPEITPDFSEAVGLEPGTYQARITDAEVLTSKKDTQYIKWKMTTISEDPKFADQLVYHNTMLSGRGAGILKTFFVAAMGEELADGQGFDTEQLLGREVMITVVEGKDQQGNPTNWPEIKAVKAIAR